MVLALILSGLVNISSHLMSHQSTELIMMLVHHYVLEEKVVKSVTGEIFLDIISQKIMNIFYLPWVD